MSRRKKIALVLLPWALFAILFVLFPPERPDTKTFETSDGTIRITLEWRTYQPGDKVHLKVTVRDSIRVAIASVKLNSSIKGLENVTFFSGGRPNWGSEITVLNPNATDSAHRECDFVLPQDLQIENKTEVDLTIATKYFFADIIAGIKFYNNFETKYVTIPLDVEVPQ